MWAVQVHHDVPFVCHHTFLPALQQTFFLHQFQSVKFTCWLESSQKYSWKTTCSNALYYFKILQRNILRSGLTPNRLDLQYLAFEYADWFACLKIKIFENIALTDGFPVLDWVLIKLRIFEDFPFEPYNVLHDSFFKAFFVDIVDGNWYTLTFVADLNDEIGSFEIFDFFFDKSWFFSRFFLEFFDDRSLSVGNFFSFGGGRFGYRGIFGFERFGFWLVKGLGGRFFGFGSWLSLAVHIQIVKRQNI